MKILVTYAVQGEFTELKIPPVLIGGGKKCRWVIFAPE